MLAVHACLGGVLIGAATGAMMLSSRRIAGNSGALKACVLPVPATAAGRDVPKILFVAGLAVVGVATGALAPGQYSKTYASIAEAWPYYVFGSFSTGLGVTFQNGCTSGHGLAGLSRLSLRSLTATPIFVVCAALTASAKSHFAIGEPVPLASETDDQLAIASAFVGAGAIVLFMIPLVLTILGFGGDAANACGAAARERFVGLATGCVFALGLALGGMVRPEVITGGLSPARFDLTLWVLFCTALAVTFGLYRFAELRLGIREARHKNKPGEIDRRLVSGAVLFGVGWGLTGFCPGPLLVSTAAEPFVAAVTGEAFTGAPLLNLVCVVLGMRAAPFLANLLFPAPPAPGPRHPQGSAADVRAALGAAAGDDGAAPLIVDVRFADGRKGTLSDSGAFVAFHGTLSAPFHDGKVPTRLLGPDVVKAAVKSGNKIVIHCMSGRRARKAADFLLPSDVPLAQSPFVCCGMSEMTEAMPAADRHVHERFFRKKTNDKPVGDETTVTNVANVASVAAVEVDTLFYQMEDGPEDGPEGSSSTNTTGGSNTLTYILGCPETSEAVIIDPVLEQLERDVAQLAKMGLRPVLALNTHCHADHITSTGLLKARFPGLKSCISAASEAKADVLLEPGSPVKWGAGRTLQVLATPGHTAGCLSFYDAEMGAVFTGDALLIGGCGRTDFQGGSAVTLYDSVHSQIFALPDDTLVYPAHDYRGRRRSTVRAEKTTNPRLTKDKAAFVDLMGNLGLSYPKKIDVALPANMQCGVFEVPAGAQKNENSKYAH